MLPKAVCSLRPSMTGWVTLTIGLPCASLPLMLPFGAGSLVSSWTVFGEDDRGQPDGELAAAEGRGQQDVGVALLGRGATGRRVDIALHQGEIGHRHVGQEAAILQRAAAGQRTVVGGGEERPRRAVVERAVDPGVGRDVEHRMGTGAGGVGDDVVPVGLDPVR